MEFNSHLAQLRHLYDQMVNGHVRDTAQAARGLLAPAIEALERMALDSPVLVPGVVMFDSEETLALREEIATTKAQLEAVTRELDRYKREADIMREAARWLFEEGFLDDLHDDDACPHDDTCECEPATKAALILNDRGVRRSAWLKSPDA